VPIMRITAVAVSAVVASVAVRFANARRERTGLHSVRAASRLEAALCGWACLHVSVTGIVAAAWHVQQAEDRTMMVAESRVVASAGLERPLLGCSSPALAACFSRDGKKNTGSAPTAATAANGLNGKCEVAGHVIDRASGAPLAGVYVIVAEESVATHPDGTFFWEGSCETIDRIQLRVTLGEGYCIAQVGGQLSAKSTREHPLYVDGRALNQAGSGACPR